MPIVKERMKTLAESVELLRFLFTDDVVPDAKAADVISNAPPGYLVTVADAFTGLAPWETEAIKETLDACASAAGTQPDQGLPARPGRGDRVDDLAAVARIPRAPRPRAHRRTPPRGRMRRAVAVLVAALLITGSRGTRRRGSRPLRATSSPRSSGSGSRSAPSGSDRWPRTPGGTTAQRTYRLRHPHVIVEHYTSGTSFDSAWNHFAANGSHLGEKPGVCAHFLIDTDGVIYQLVYPGIRCRHAIGMNWTAFGIEHVGTSAGRVLRNDRMMRSSLRLTVWLMARYDISWGNVIGHAEILQSPFHRERYESWRCRTHADFDRDEMRRYRRRLKRTAMNLGVPIGAGPRWVESGC